MHEHSRSLSFSIIMGAVTVEEIASLQREFDWVLTTEVSNVIKELKAAVMVSTYLHH